MAHSIEFCGGTSSTPPHYPKIDKRYTYVYGIAMGFEWDEEKRRSNIADHEVDFRVAVRIFRHPVIEAPDERDDYGEVRIRALGHIDEEYYLVVYTWRGTNRRIISAWKVGEHGKRRYQTLLSERP